MELIKKQIEKTIEELRKRGLSNGGTLGYHAGWCDEAADQLENAFSLIKELTEENERLREQNERYAELEEGCYVTGYKNIKADTVRQMQERLIAEFRKDDRMNYYLRKTLDQIAKEMLEGEK